MATIKDETNTNLRPNLIDGQMQKKDNVIKIRKFKKQPMSIEGVE